MHEFSKGVHSVEVLLIYVKDQFKTWTVSKPSDGFKTGQTALSPARRLKNGPRRL